MKTLEQLMQDYEKAITAYHKTKPLTQKSHLAGKRLDKAVEALAQYRANEGLTS